MLELPYSIKVLDSIPLDAYYYNTSGQPYTNTAQVISQVSSGVRYRGQTFNVAGVEYWFSAGTADGDLIAKSSFIGGTLSANRIPYATGASTLADGPHWDNTNTRLGIGAAPSHPLHVTRNQNASTRIQITNTDTTNGASRSEFRATSGAVDLSMIAIGTTTPGVFIGSGTNHSLMLTTNGSDRVTINTSGNVGVGAAPSYRLHATHNQNATTSLAVTNTDTTNDSSRSQLLAESATLSASVLAVGNGASAGAYLGAISNHTAFIMANGSAKLRVTPAGVISILTAPANDDALTQVLVRDAVTGDIKYKAVSTFSVPAGLNTQIQYNNSGVFGASANLTFASNTLSVNGLTQLGAVGTYAITDETVQITKLHSSYTSIQNALTIHVAGSSAPSVTDGFGGQIKLGIGNTLGVVSRTGIFAHSWVTIGSLLSKVRYGQVVGANLTSGVDFFSDGTTSFINGSGNLVLGLTTTGVKPDNYGVKHARASTGSIAASSSSNVNVAWSTAFPDTNYTVVASVFCSTTNALVVFPTTKSTGSVDILVANQSLGSVSGEVNVIAFHD